MSLRRSWYVLAILFAALLLLLVWRGDSFWQWLAKKRVHYEGTIDGHTIRGWQTVNRWAKSPVGNGPAMAWYVENGLKATEVVLHHGMPTSRTEWSFDGQVRLQLETDAGGIITKKEEPPWWWGVEDQEPSSR